MWDKKPGGESRSLVVLTRRQIRLIHVRAYVHFSMHTMASRQTTLSFLYLFFRIVYSCIISYVVNLNHLVYTLGGGPYTDIVLWSRKGRKCRKERVLLCGWLSRLLISSYISRERPSWFGKLLSLFMVYGFRASQLSSSTSLIDERERESFSFCSPGSLSLPSFLLTNSLCSLQEDA